MQAKQKLLVIIKVMSLIFKSQCRYLNQLRVKQISISVQQSWHLIHSIFKLNTNGIVSSYSVPPVAVWHIKWLVELIFPAEAVKYTEPIKMRENV